MFTFFDRCFKFTERKTTPGIEVLAGATTFLAMAYIIFVNPNILATTGMDKTALITVTCIATAIATLMTGLFANAPIAMAPGMGLNAFFAYSLVLSEKVNWPTALGIAPMPISLVSRLISAMSEGSTQPGTTLSLWLGVPVLTAKASAMRLTMVEKPVTCEPA